MALQIPTVEELEELEELIGPGPVWVIFRARFAPGGRLTMVRYSAAVARLEATSGARPIQVALVAPAFDGVGWDRVTIVEYPSLSAYADIIGNELHQRVGRPLLEEALSDLSWMACRPVSTMNWLAPGPWEDDAP